MKTEKSEISKDSPTTIDKTIGYLDSLILEKQNKAKLALRIGSLISLAFLLFGLYQVSQTKREYEDYMTTNEVYIQALKDFQGNIRLREDVSASVGNLEKQLAAQPNSASLQKKLSVERAELEQLQKRSLSEEALKNDYGANLEKSRASLGADFKRTQTFINMPYALYIVAVLIFSLSFAQYRKYLSEASRAESFKFGLWRIRIAALNYSIPGFQSEVRQALTINAFEFDSLNNSAENPLQGYLPADLFYKLLDKIKIPSGK